ncbi:MAG: hypothetical protein D3916_15725, partial [Candidatus Electrothrix sp. MAN1_4]|nr:hypothetical protein [Candidatus Electrothrix sp. MAN1_4]
MLPESFSQKQIIELEKPYLDLFATLTGQGVSVLDFISVFKKERNDKQL